MEELIFTTKKKPKRMYVRDTVVMRVHKDTYEAVSEIQDLTGRTKTGILKQITDYAMENAIFLDPGANAEGNVVQDVDIAETDQIDKLLELAQTLERTIDKVLGAKGGKSK